MKTSKPIREIEFFIPVKPVPASRARVSQYGTFYLKNYQEFRDSCKNYLKKIAKKYPIQFGTFEVEMEFICYKPKQPSQDFPRGDLDNFLKGPLDCITQSKMLWEDDMYITSLTGTKRYQENGEEFGIKVIVKCFN